MASSGLLLAAQADFISATLLSDEQVCNDRDRAAHRAGSGGIATKGASRAAHTMSCGADNAIGARRHWAAAAKIPRSMRLAGLVLCVLVGISGLCGAKAQAQTTDTWDSKMTTQANTGHENGRIVRGSGSERTLRIKGSFVFSACPASPASCYRCVFANEQDQSFSEDSTSLGTYDSTLSSEITCNTLSTWGLSYDAAKVELLIQKNAGTAVNPVWQTLSQNPNRGKYFIFLEEDIFSVIPVFANAFQQTVTIIGSGFSSNKQYQCITFEGPTSDTWPAQIVSKASKGFTGLQGFPFAVLNRTVGTCSISTSFSARSTKISIMTYRAAVNTLTTVRDRPENGYQSMQPALYEITKPASGGNDVIVWKGLDIEWYESWNYAYRLEVHNGVEERFDMISGLREGGQDMYFDGAGFKSAEAGFAETYYCEYTYNSHRNSGCDGIVNLDTNYQLTSPVVLVEPTRLMCTTPAWTFNLPLASTVIKIRASSSRLITENLESPFIKFFSSFEYVTQPQFTANTPNESTVYVEGVDCASLNLSFTAFGGMSPLRLTLDYTPLRPQPGKDFLYWGDDAPTVEDVLLKTDDLQTKYFVESAKLDNIQISGYCLGELTHSLALPDMQLPEKKSSSHVVFNKVSQQFERVSEGLGIGDNELQPSNLTFTTTISGDEVSGQLFWNVSRGWEGYGYRLCVTARHVSTWWVLTLTSPNFATRCIYVVVPKCRKCYGPGDDLASIAFAYGSNWLDLWSVNLALINTTREGLDDEVFNTRGDQLYPLVGERQTVRLGLAYLVRQQDTLEGVGKRFGMSLRNVMQLNPDVVAANQGAEFNGKHLCILPSASQYSRCSRPAEQPEPQHFEAKYRGPFYYDYDVTGAPIKQHNERFPQPPLAPPPHTPAPAP